MTIEAPDYATCQCSICTGASLVQSQFAAAPGDAEFGSVDPDRGGTLNGKPIWGLGRIEENLNRSGYDWYTNNYGELNDGVLNFGFWKNFAELANSYYVTEDGNDAFGEVNRRTFSAFNAEQAAAARTSIGMWDDLVSISFQESKSGSADITFGNTATGGAQAYAYLPFGSTGDAAFYQANGIEQVGRLGGDVWIDGFVMSNFTPLQNSYYSVTTLIHEIGHAIGLSHPGDYDALDDDDGDGEPDPITYQADAAFAQDSLQYSIMSYFDAYETGAQYIDWSLANFAYPSTPQVHDIAAIQAIYGADMTTRTGDTVYGFNSTADRAAFDFTANTRPIVSIWDAGGNDTLDFSGWNTDSTIDLNPGAFSSGGGIEKFLTLEEINANREALGFAPRTQEVYQFYLDLQEQLGLKNGLFKDNISIAYGATIENAVGGGGDDLIVANKVANRIDGGEGNDTVSYDTADIGVKVRLGGAVGGGAEGDTLISIENVIGSDFRDRLVGTNADNVIEGGGGNDRMTGKGGADTFVFATKGSIGNDIITDFGRGDVIVVDKRLVDRDDDGLIAVGRNGRVSLDITDGDAVVLQGFEGDLQYLGKSGGQFYYGMRGTEMLAAEPVEAARPSGSGASVVIPEEWKYDSAPGAFAKPPVGGEGGSLSFDEGRLFAAGHAAGAAAMMQDPQFLF